MDLFAYDENEGVTPLCGVDEAGRGPLAGSVYAAAVILPSDARIEGLNDSKKLTPKKRDALYEEITHTALAYCIASATVAEIEEHNILQASLLAMRRAVEGLSIRPALILVDGNQTLHMDIHSRCVVKGDATSACIAAASILAKVERDRYMDQLAHEYPQYQFDKHKGYGTALHYQMLDQFGPSPVHRLSFLKTYLPGAENTRAKKGRIGEAAVCDHLEKAGYRIVERNYQCALGEVDILAEKDGLLAVVEVKARTEGGVATAREAVSASKQQKLLRTGMHYLQQMGGEQQLRFDVAEVYFAKAKPAPGKEPLVTRLNYLEGAFDGGKSHAHF